MKGLRGFVCAGACLILLGTAAAGAQSVHRVSVTMDESTTADDDLLTAAAYAAPAGNASQSVRKLAAGLVGEVQLLLNQRVDQNDMLTMDDGSVVALSEDDVIEVTKKKACEKDCPGGGGGSNGVVIIRKGTGRPVAIEFHIGGVCRRLTFVEQGRPTFQDIKCPAQPAGEVP
jgi:hypothetical protein